MFFNKNDNFGFIIWSPAQECRVAGRKVYRTYVLDIVKRKVPANNVKRYKQEYAKIGLNK